MLVEEERWAINPAWYNQPVMVYQRAVGDDGAVIETRVDGDGMIPIPVEDVDLYREEHEALLAAVGDIERRAAVEYTLAVRRAINQVRDRMGVDYQTARLIVTGRTA